ncbi:alcohol dehydrogenase [Defluviimonas sp. 20V17]|uniref:Alcohol dehydrogenase n=1 Tax=Allgaiera indica TaxID=765699 RepID=A0AAN5A082_9RHOB|nr:iron-containing alcohol dehydrogenase [Allgaiera indica]KDB02585.1 alcohol dehydrogenase [Defluviimonas sp. 20V17]GHE01703.1 alcohol dehydrogenase [Allgaiera indica]SDW95327.1 hypothetical protein SAMN05444006_108117 [Allgaiera indica]
MVLPSFSFASAAEIRFGRGLAAEAAKHIAAFGHRVLLVHGADPARARWLRDSLPHVICIACTGEPDLSALDAALAKARAAEPEVVVALGGGAVIDMAKALAALIPAPGAILDHLEVVGQGLPLTVAPLPMVALPTTAGTGAEVTRNAVIGVPEARRKVSLRDLAMLPRLALVDPALTDGCPWGVTLASGLDALTQVIEPYLCTRANPMTDALCRAAIPMALPALMRLDKAEDPDARDAMAYVSLSGGLALANAGLGAVHGLAGVIGGETGAPHGAICGALLAPVLTALSDAAAAGSPLQARLEEVAAWLAPPLGVSPDAAFTALANWAHGAGLAGLGGLGVAVEARDRIARQAQVSSSMRASPVTFDSDALAAILEAAHSPR